MDGDGALIWSDPHLTESGVTQAGDSRLFWHNASTELKILWPEVFYTSPMTRCLETARYTFSPEMTDTWLFRPIVKESRRQQFGVYTCDRRSALSAITTRFPECEIEHDFTEDDKLWVADHRETLEEARVRLEGFLQQLFLNDESTYVSLTTHSGAIRALEAAIGHPDVLTAPGAIVPFLVQGGQRFNGEGPKYPAKTPYAPNLEEL